MRYFWSFGTTLLLLAPSLMLGAQGITAQEVTVGRNLEVPINVMLAEAAPEKGLKLRVTSDDPSKLLLSDAPDRAGSASIEINVLENFRASALFFVQALSDAGNVSYTVTGEGIPAAKGTVKMAPSGLAIIGPRKAPSYTTTPRGLAMRLQILPVLLDADNKPVDQQQIAGGMSFPVKIKTSDAKVGVLGDPEFKFGDASNEFVTWFVPVEVGQTTFSIVQPSGFKTPADYAAVSAVVETPGLAVMTDTFIGKDLQMEGTICLGSPAPRGGLKVTLKSDDPSKLVFSADGRKLGTPQLEVTVPEGQAIASYIAQALSDSGEASYTGTAAGYRPREGRIALAQSAIIIAYYAYGPPDEASVKRKGGVKEDRKFFASKADPKPQYMTLFSCYVHPNSGMCADITVQSVRGGKAVSVDLHSSNPEIATIPSTATIQGGDNAFNVPLTLVSKGTTVLSVDTPAGFTESKNATKVPGVIAE